MRIIEGSVDGPPLLDGQPLQGTVTTEQRLSEVPGLSVAM